MRYQLSALILCLFCSFSHAQVLIKNTNVFDVENKKVLSGYDVLAVDGKIVSVDKGQKYMPIGTKILDGTGKYLVPGFNDAHVHFFQSGSIYTRPDAIDLRKYRSYAAEIKFVHDNMENFLRRYTTAGITSVADVGSNYHFLNQRDSFASKSYAPEIAMTGALLTTYIPPAFENLGNESPFMKMETEEGVRKSVRDLRDAKADFIKIWYIVMDPDKEKGARKNLPLVSAVIDEAHKSNLRVAVHATEKITARLAVEAGADYLVHSVEDEPVDDAFIKLLKKKNTVLCPTMVVGHNYRKAFGHTYTFSTDELSLADPYTIGTLIDFPMPDTALGNRYMKSVGTAKAIVRQEHADSLLAANLKALQDGGVIIATGTDAGNIGTQHSSSYFTELQAMQKAGLNMWDLLTASTLNGAKAMGRQNSVGSITKGKAANMILLNADPLSSLDNWRKIKRVINRGIVLDPDTLIHNSPEMLAQQQLNGYNAHDIDAFLEPYADDAEIYSLDGKVEMKGKEDMRKKYSAFIKRPGLYCRLLNRIVEGNTVIDHEEIHAAGLKKPIYGIAIYVIENGKIKKVYFPK